MQMKAVTDSVALAPRTPLSADVTGLRGVHGTMLIRVEGAPLGALVVDDRQVKFLPDVRDAKAGDAIVDFDDANDIRELLDGKVNPVVASIQRRLTMQGDRLLGARIVLGLRTGAVFKPLIHEKA